MCYKTIVILVCVANALGLQAFAAPAPVLEVIKENMSGGGRLLFMSRWGLDKSTNSLIVVVTQENDVTADTNYMALQDHILRVYETGGDGPREIFRHDGEARFVCGFAIQGAPEFATVWSGGSGNSFRVYEYAGEAVSVTLDVGSKLPIEVVNSANFDEARPYFLATDTLGYLDEPRKWITTIYGWSGRAYSPIKTVTYPRRLEQVPRTKGKRT